MPGLHIVVPRSLAAPLATVVALLAFAPVAPDALAQRPSYANDALYRNVSAKRDFHDGYAVRGDLSYQSLDPSNLAGASNLGVLLKADARLSSQFDISAILNAYGGVNGQNVRLSWIAVKHIWHQDGADMAIRVAFEPRPPIGGGLGFRQTDIGFLYSKSLSPLVGTDIAAGLRWVRTGYQPVQALESLDQEFGFTEAKGLEAHIVIGYNMIFDPAMSHVSMALVYEAGRYDLVGHTFAPLSQDPTKGAFRAHVLWVRSGLHFHRPTYQLIPYLSVPLASGKQGEGPSPGRGPRFINLGLQVTIR